MKMGNAIHQEFAAEFHQSINPAQAEFDRLVSQRIVTPVTPGIPGTPGTSTGAQNITFAIRETGIFGATQRAGARS